MSNSLLPRLKEVVFKKRRNVLMYGEGGTGKSYNIKLLLQEAIKKQKVMHLTSTTGLSALAIDGMTIHRWSGIKLGEEPIDIIISEIYKKNRECLERWKTTDMLVMDEVSMLGKKTIQLIDQVGRKIRKIDKPFGGIQVILTGDFCQLPAVNDAYCFESDTMKELNLYPIKCDIPYRYPDIKHFELLQRVRKGEMISEDITLLQSRVDCYQEYLTNQDKKNKKVKKEGAISLDDIKPTRIYALKRDVDRENTIELKQLPGLASGYTCYDQFFKTRSGLRKKAKTEEEVEVPADEQEAYGDYLETLAKEQLQFKIGAQVMLTCNADPDSGLVNGSRGIVTGCLAEGVKVLFRNGVETIIGFNEYKHKDAKYKVIRHQIPLILAWTTTIHKSQGQTLDYVIIDLGTSLFGAGMGYVALSRAKTIEGVFLINFLPEKIYADPKALKYEEELDEIEKNNLQQETQEKEVKEKKEDENEPGLSIEKQLANMTIRDSEQTLDIEGNRDYEEDEIMEGILDEVKRIAEIEEESD